MRWPSSGAYECINGSVRYNAGFGSALGRSLGIGYVQELVARLTHTPIATHNSSTNATLNDNPITFPLDQSLHVDATHETVVMHGPCLAFKTSKLQLTCPSAYGAQLNYLGGPRSTTSGPYPERSNVQSVSGSAVRDERPVSAYVHALPISSGHLKPMPQTQSSHVPPCQGRRFAS